MVRVRYIDHLRFKDKTIERINDHYGSGLTLSRRSGDLPVWMLDFSKSDPPLAIAEFVCELHQSALKSQFSLANELGDYLEFIKQFDSSRPDGSFPPMFNDLVNIKYALEDLQPDLILEIGGGVSSSLFGRYSDLSGCKYFLVDPEYEWASNTLNILNEIPGVNAPRLLNLEVHGVYREVQIIDQVTGMKKRGIINSNKEFSYSSEELFQAVESSEKPLVYVDAAPKGSVCQGAEFILNDRLREALSGGLCLVDCRWQALNLLGAYARNIYTSACDVRIAGKRVPTSNNWVLMEDLAFSAFAL